MSCHIIFVVVNPSHLPTSLDPLGYYSFQVLSKFMHLPSDKGQGTFRHYKVNKSDPDCFTSC